MTPHPCSNARPIFRAARIVCVSCGEPMTCAMCDAPATLLVGAPACEAHWVEVNQQANVKRLGE